MKTKRLSALLWLRHLHSARLTVVCLMALAALVVWGTLYQAQHGLYAGQVRFFHSWILLVWGFVPFPGVKPVLLLLSANLVASMVFRLFRSWRDIGLMLVHVGIAALLAAAGFAHYFAEQSFVTLAEGESTEHSLSGHGWELGASAVVREHVTRDRRRVALPVRIHLVDFSIKRHPGTTIVRSFDTRLHVKGEAIDREVVVSMNRPFRYKDFTFFQTSYAETGTGETCTLAVVRNPGRLLPYISSIAIVLGLLTHFALKSWLLLRTRK